MPQRFSHLICMDVPDSGRALWYRTSRPLGKVRRRVLDLRIPSSSYCDFVVSGRRLDLSHNESARLAVDCLLNRDLEGYERVLKADGEVDFLSQTEKSYILENGTDVNTDGAGEPDEEDKDFESLSADGRCSAPSAVTDSTVDCLDQSGPKDVKWIPGSADDQSIGVFFQSDSRAAGMKDLLRQLIRKANTALAIVMDSFSDAELLCDLLEASRKRNVSVHLLLDHQDLNTFVSMWQDLKLDGKNFPMSVRSVRGQTYRAKTGRKLTGQIAESFVITDWTEVLTGSYSFTWLSWQVHRSVAVLLRGSSVTPFHHEFQRLYSDSQPVLGFAALVTPPQTLCPASRDGRESGAVNSRGRSDQPKTAALWTWLEEAESVDANPATAVWGTGRSALASGPERDPPAAGPELQSAERPVSASNLLAERSRRDQSHLLYPSTQQQMQPIASHRFVHYSQIQTKIFFQEPRWQDQSQRPLFHPHSITTPPYSEPPAAAAGAHLRPHLQADSKSFPPGGRLQIHQLPTSYQQTNCPPWLNRTPQSHQAAGPRAVARYNSFGGSGAREGLDWRSPQRSLQSSRNMAQRGTAGLF
ncbi:protein FAM83A-like isoform 2-T2 [Menidia menidia]